METFPSRRLRKDCRLKERQRFIWVSYSDGMISNLHLMANGDDGVLMTGRTSNCKPFLDLEMDYPEVAGKDCKERYWILKDYKVIMDQRITKVPECQFCLTAPHQRSCQPAESRNPVGPREEPKWSTTSKLEDINTLSFRKCGDGVEISKHFDSRGVPEKKCTEVWNSTTQYFRLVEVEKA
jgi:hypothetical protein